jgi:DNA mismatch repair protein MutS
VLANLEKAEFDETGDPIAAHKTGGGEGGKAKREEKSDDNEPVPQLGLFASREGLLARELANLDLNAMTPLEAMNMLAELKKKAER